MPETLIVDVLKVLPMCLAKFVSTDCNVELDLRLKTGDVIVIDSCGVTM